MSNFLTCIFVYFYVVSSTKVMAQIDQREFFESKIRPVLVEHCYECHNSWGKAKSQLTLDSRDGLLKGGSEGPSIIPGKPEDSILLQSIRHDFKDLRMPKSGPRLSNDVLEDFRIWITNGAFDPREKPPSIEQLEKTTSWEAVRERRMQWWSFQPIRKIEPPQINDGHPVDQFLISKMHQSGIEPNDNAEGLTILRRLSFALTGLPPTIEEQDRFSNLANNDLSSTVDRFADELLESPHFGERWARHWMDWVRYADSHGSEGDPQIPNAYRYRNYLIRALNQDIGFDRLVREHIAGDLIKEPRINQSLGINESAIGTAHLRFVLHGFAPTDALDEHVRFTDDQIDAVTKTFLGLTVSCARCHHHKFDAISQDDYYALFGILSNGRPAQKVIEDPAHFTDHEKTLLDLKNEIKNEIVKVWKKIDLNIELGANKKSTEKNALNFLRPWEKLHSLIDDNFSKEWDKLKKQVKESEARLNVRRSTVYPLSWELKDPKTYSKWKKSGTGLKNHPSKSGLFTLSLKGDKILEDILPAGAYTHLLSTKQNGTLSSPRFKFVEGDLWVRVVGDQGTTVRYSVWNYPRRGTVYKRSSPDPLAEKWINFKTNYWAGETGYLEVTTNRDHPVEAGNAERSWFGVTEALLATPGQGQPKDEIAEVLSPLFANLLLEKNKISLKKRYLGVIKDTIDSWENDSLTDTQARILNSLVKQGILPNTKEELPSCYSLVQKYRKIEELIKAPRLAPGVLDGVPFDQALFTRGDHKKPAHNVPRRFLEAIDSTPYPDGSSGRLEFAQDLLRKDNPFTARVIVNRIWHHLFGNGLVRTPDNFGRLGELPSHPELLDFLAHKFRKEGWSIKRMIKFLVTSEVFRSSSNPSFLAKEIDPQNLLLSHANLRRLEAEPIRDAMLLVSGRLQLGRVAEGISEPQNSQRRSVYRRVQRNSLDPFLSVFDAPVPSSTTGRRDITNVPAQSLTLMNDPEVLRGAREFANLHRTGHIKNRISELFRKALGREPSSGELNQSIDYLNATGKEAAMIKASLSELTLKLRELNDQVTKVTEPTRQKIINLRNVNSALQESQIAKPSLHWDFKNGLVDSIAGVKCFLKKGAKLENGELIVKQSGYAVTEKLPFEVSEKTLSSWVKLDNLNQRAGGVMTIQNLTGGVFDSIVYAEKESRKWMSGSNGFARTKAFISAPIEIGADQEFVHLAITYSSNGTITGYRNGEIYGQPYQANSTKFLKAESVISFGVRHLPASPNRLLQGRIKKASLFDRALTSDEILSKFNPGLHITEEKIVNDLSPEQKETYRKLLKELEIVKKKIKKIEEFENTNKPDLQDLALALFNMKEFIYIK